LLLSFNGFAQTHNHEHDAAGIMRTMWKRKPHAVALKKTNRFFTNKFKVTEAHASKFGRLVIQDAGGRMKPINTFSSELLKR
jgi:hypothetical protein